MKEYDNCDITDAAETWLAWLDKNDTKGLIKGVYDRLCALVVLGGADTALGGRLADKSVAEIQVSAHETDVLIWDELQKAQQDLNADDDGMEIELTDRIIYDDLPRSDGTSSRFLAVVLYRVEDGRPLLIWARAVRRD